MPRRVGKTVGLGAMIVIVGCWSGVSCAAGGVAGWLPSWHASGSATVRGEYYDVRGDTSSSPYRNEGRHGYGEFSIGMTRRDSPFRLWRIQAAGVMNGSDYRSPDRGAVLERLHLFHERGDTSLPFRFEAGDLFGFFSYRTLQRSLRGVQVELQPLGQLPLRQSLQLVAGAAGASNWRHAQMRDEVTAGMSYLLGFDQAGTLALNYVYNVREAEPAAGLPQRRQQTYSLAGERRWNLWGTGSLTLEGELALFRGDHNTAQDQDDIGIFLQGSGRLAARPLSYRVRFEQYGADFRPAGAAVGASRRSTELHLGYRLDTGLQLRGRLQLYRDGFQSADPTDTTTYGFGLNGPLLTQWLEGLAGGMEVFFQDVCNRSRTTDALTSSVQANVRKSLADGWSARLGAAYRRTKNKVAGAGNTETRQVSIGLDHRLAAFGLLGTLSPGLTYRKVTGPADDTVDLVPTLGLSLANGPHSLSYNLSYSVQDRRIANGTDVRTLSNAIRYQYRMGRNVLGVEGSSEYRLPDPGTSTTTYRVAVFWTRSFDRPPRSTPKRKREDVGAALAGAAGKVWLADIADLWPGRGMETLNRLLASSGIRGGAALPNGMMVYETRLFPEIEQRQRLVLAPEDGKLLRAAVIVDVSGGSGGDEMARIYEQLRKELIKRHGRPARVYEKGGDWPQDVQQAVNDGRFVRITEWDLPGGVLRLGVPRRLDRLVRIEIQFGDDFPPETETLWSIEEVR